MEINGLYYSQQNGTSHNSSNGLEQVTFPIFNKDSYSSNKKQYFDHQNNNTEDVVKRIKAKYLQQQEDRIIFRCVQKYVINLQEAAVPQIIIKLQDKDCKKQPKFRINLPSSGVTRVTPSVGEVVDDSPSSVTESQASTLSDLTPPINEAHESFSDTESTHVDHKRAQVSDLQSSDISQATENSTDLEFPTLDDVSSEVEKTVTKREEPLTSAGVSSTVDETELHTKIDQSSAGPLAGSFCEEDQEFEFLKVKSKRRSTSLKSSVRTDLRCKKKGVRFADVLGLDLESVKHIISTSEPPAVPSKALLDLKLSEKADDDHKAPAEQTLQLYACFSQPSSAGDYESRVFNQKVLLETLSMDDVNLAVTGCICVANFAYTKHVFVRYTTNGWLTYNDVVASYLCAANRGRFDKFLFKIKLPESFGYGSRLEFAVSYESAGHVYWDNNSRGNYRVECYYKQVP